MDVSSDRRNGTGSAPVEPRPLGWRGRLRGGAPAIIVVAKIGVSVLLIALMISYVDGPQFVSAAENLEWHLLAWAFVLNLVAYVIGGVRWWLCLRVQGFPHSLRQICMLRFAGQGLNVLLPGGMVGDVLQIGAVVDRSGLTHSRALAGVVVDRALGLLALAIPGGLILLTIGARSAQFQAVVENTVLGAGAAVSLGLIVLIVLGVVSRRTLYGRLGHWADMVTRTLSSLESYRRHPLTLLLVFLLGGASALVLAAALTVVGISFGHLSLLYSYLAIVVATFASLIPISYGGAGVREIAFVAIFVQAGLGEASAAVLSLAWLAVVVTTAMVMTAIGFMLSEFRVAGIIAAVRSKK